MPPTSLSSIPGLTSLPPQSLHAPSPSTHGARVMRESGVGFSPTHGARRDSSPGLATGPLSGTEIGVPPAPMSRPLDVQTGKQSRIWVLIGAVVAIAVGIAIALMVVS